MQTREGWPVTITVELDPEGLKRVVEQGRLLEFADTLSELAGDHLKVKVVEQLAEAAVGVADSAHTIQMGFELDEPYGTPPKPWPWVWRRAQEFQLRELIDTIFNEKLAASGRM